ncbi:MAG TPA: PIG-L family deacetylase [Thermoanaerobaculia bacterium]
MLIEAEAIPYEASQLRGERLLVLAPHPDDEVIGCGGLIALHLREGRSVRILVATDGAEAGDAPAREEECRRGVGHLGEVDLHFLRFPDRALDESAAPVIRQHLLEFRPDLILVPGPGEIHPDHLALSRLFCDLVQRDELLFADLATARVAFYEVSQPLRPNAIVDITPVSEQKYAAIGEHASQLRQRDYAGYARGLNTYRAMTLPPEMTLAEAYHVVELPVLRTTPFSRLRQTTGAPPLIETEQTSTPVSVVIRTKNRLALLREAIESVFDTRHPCQLVIVNDGGESPATLLASLEPAPNQTVTLVEHRESAGRAAAGNAGAEAAIHPLLTFLDDDDLHYAEHLQTLVNASHSQHAGWYSDAVSSFLSVSPDGTHRSHSRLRLFAHDYDPELLLLDNYIPLPTLLVPRRTFLDAGGFDTAFDLFEDWDLLIRLTARGPLLRIPRITCEVRHFESGSSVVLAAPEGSEEFRAAKLRIWNKHRGRIDDGLVAGVFEKQKRRLQTLFSEIVETRGQLAGVRQSAAAADRQSVERQEAIGRYMVRAAELEGALSSANETAAAALSTAVSSAMVRIEELAHENEALRIANRTTSEELGRALAEIGRLQSLLDMIFRSKTWKLHTVVEKFRGRG